MQSSSFLDCVELRGFRGEIYQLFANAAESEQSVPKLLQEVESRLRQAAGAKYAAILTAIHKDRAAAELLAAQVSASLSLSGGTR